jgi:hypothetical protein
MNLATNKQMFPLKEEEREAVKERVYIPKNNALSMQQVPQPQILSNHI